jgi:glycosyltransferase involved in cell wall biosynthesis
VGTVVARPFVSVLIDTYNHERFIEQAISSVLEQNFPPGEREIVVVDDGSTDNTPAIVRKFVPRVSLFQKANGGQSSAFNAGIPKCRGEIIAFLDGDDWWMPEKLRRVVNTMAGNPSIGMVGHGFVESFGGGRTSVIALERSARLHLTSVPAAQFFRLSRCYLGTSRLALRAKIARKILPVPESLVIEADEYLFTMAAALDEFVILSEPLTHYRIHGGNLFLAAGSNLVGVRRKQRALTALAAALGNRLPTCSVPKDVVDCVVEIVAAEAAQLRLALDGGSPWETYRTESTIYRIQHSDASQKQRLFRQATMILALLLPPQWFYGVRRWLADQSWYSWARREILPVPGFTKTTTPATSMSSQGVK